MTLVHISPDMTVGDLIVGVGTLALAGFTAWLASRTSAEVAASEEQIQLARESIEAQERPFVAITKHKVVRGIKVLSGTFYCGLTNYGKGPASIEKIELRNADGSDVLAEPPGFVYILAPGEPSGRGYSVVIDRFEEGERLTAKIWYRSASGSRYLTDTILEFVGESRFRSRGHLRLDVTSGMPDEQLTGAP